VITGRRSGGPLTAGEDHTVKKSKKNMIDIDIEVAARIRKNQMR
jgi:hypothetical protein